MKIQSSFLILLLACAGAPVFADEVDREGARTPTQSQTILPFEQLLKIARGRVGQQKLLDAGLSKVGNRAVVELFFLGENGQVQSVRLDAQTADVINQNPNSITSANTDRLAPARAVRSGNRDKAGRGKQGGRGDGESSRGSGGGKGGGSGGGGGRQ